MGSSKQTTTSSQQQSATTKPYAPTIPLLNQELGGISSLIPGYQATPAETSALTTLANNANQLPNYGGTTANLASSYLGGDPTGLLKPALSQYQSVMNPIATANLDPTQTPGISSVLDTIRNDVTNSVNGMFAGAGRDLSGLNQQALARGISQGEAVPLLNQYNQNVQNATGAANGLLGAVGTTASALTGNQTQGLNIASLVPQFMNTPAGQQLAVAAAQRQLPISNLAQLEGLTIPIAGLGTEAQGTANGTSTSTSSPSLLGDILGIGSLFAGGPNSAVSGFFSDRRLKKDIEQIGKLNDGTPIYRFRYLHDPTIQIGLMADDIEKSAPEAVVDINGYKAVDYGRATNRAAEMGAS